MAFLSVGILAHNEADIIAGTIASLSLQSILLPNICSTLGLDQVEIFVVPNGCSDDTAAVAKRALGQIDPAQVTTSVRSLPQPGKSAAWNAFVHDLSSPEATIIVLMDADIELASSDVIEKLVRRLVDEPQRLVTTDVPIKDFRGAGKLSISRRASLAASAQRVTDHAICGQLYCARADALRSVWMPPHLPVEDGFLAAMIMTAGFTRQPIEETIIRVRDASHYYETYTGISGFLGHECRIIVGSVINQWLFDVLWRAGKRGHVGSFIKTRNEEDPHWVDGIVADAKAKRGWWLVPAHFIFWRLLPLRHQPLSKALTRAPVAIAATIIAFTACIKANGILRRRAASNHW
ncbi:MAG: hypothetical protein JWR80_3172 [Bradyrhizobium sp.]|nr:hypothetical protein [Bradyrhizobium sp.]